MSSLSYEEMLAVVEKFMIDSKIRQYCTEICKGKCCGSCSEKNKQTCSRHEKRRLSCSIYLCAEMLNLFSVKDRRQLTDSGQLICDQYDSYYKLQCCRKNAYFTAPSKTFFEIVRFSIIIKMALEEIDIKKAKTKINKLIKENKQIYN